MQVIDVLLFVKEEAVLETKKMDGKTVSQSVIAAIIGSLLMLGGVSITDDDAYYCEDRSIVMSCDKVSAYYGLENGKCWNEEVGNKLCKTGWAKIEKSFVLEEKNETIKDDDIIDDTDNTKNDYKGVKQYICNSEGCLEK